MPASAAAPRRRITMRSNNRLPADRIAAALGTLPIAPPAEVPSRSTIRRHQSVSGPSSSPPAVAESGRHRGAAEQMGELFPPAPADPGPRRHERAPREALGEFSRVGSSRARSASAAPAPVAPVGGRHRRTTPTKGAMSVGLLAAGAKSHRLMVLGVLVILVAVAVAFGVRAALAPPVAQPELVATTAQGQFGVPSRESGAVQISSSRRLL